MVQIEFSEVRFNAISLRSLRFDLRFWASGLGITETCSALGLRFMVLDFGCAV